MKHIFGCENQNVKGRLNPLVVIVKNTLLVTRLTLKKQRWQEDPGDATRVKVRRGGGGESLRQSQQDVFHQHGADHHLLTVDGQLGRSLLFGRHGDQHQAAAGYRPAREPVDRMIRRRDRRTEVKAAG